LAVSAAALLALPMHVRASVGVEQIEAGYDNGTAPYYSYAPVEFGGSPTVVGTGPFAGITFHAVDTANDTDTSSDHAYIVGTYLYGSPYPAYAFVSNVYCEDADDFLYNTVKTQASTGLAPLPGSFAAGVQVVNDSWNGSYNMSAYPNANLDAIRRFDYMINVSGVVSVAGVAGTGASNPLFWASYNTIGVAGPTGGFSPAGSPTKQHIDMYTPQGVQPTEASFGTGLISGFAVGLIGNAPTAGQANYVIRSLLYTGTDKPGYTNPGGGNLGGMDPNFGADQPDYDTSLAILQEGQRNLLTVSGISITGTPATVQEGWATGTVAKGTQDVVLIQSANAITGITASLNWNVTCQTSGSQINTNSLIFPNLTFEVRPVTYNAGSYSLGTSESSPLFHSSVSGDNTQYICTTTSNLGLPAGTYALLITGDSALPATVGVSYLLAGSFASQWNSSTGGSWGSTGLWSNGIPNGDAAQANFLSSPGITAPATITLDGDRVVGQMTFNNSNGYTIAQGIVAVGNYGHITINDTGDSSGSPNPLILVQRGSQTISLPLNLINGVTTNINANSSLAISGIISGSGTLTKSGAGTLTLSNSETYGNTNISGGTLVLTSTGALTGGPIAVASGGTLDFAASGGGGILVRQLSVPLNINSGGSTVVAPTPVIANRQLIVATGGLSIAGTLNNWIGKLDLSNNDLDIPAGNLATVTNQLQQGYASGRWNGTGGIVSSAAGGDTTHLTALGVILNTVDGSTPLYGSGTLMGTFDGISPAATDLLVKYTYFGDANLDGRVDGSDYARIDNGVLLKLTGWYNGDFNYDGVINGSDYTLIDNAYNTQGAQMEAVTAVTTAEVATATSVPEPTLGSLIIAAATASLLRRRKLNAMARSLRLIRLHS
jgi:autotransporter-associated beta strand protein